MLIKAVCCAQVVDGEVAAALSNGAHGVDIHVPAAVHSTSHDVSSGKRSLRHNAPYRAVSRCV